MENRRAILDSLRDERTVDIVTTGRHSGTVRTTEIWTTIVDGQTYICGTPNASKAGVTHQRRDWLANLAAHPEFTIRLKTSVSAVLTARAELVTELGERRAVLTAPNTEYYRDAAGLDAALAHSPMVRVTFTGDAAWLDRESRARG